MQMKGGNERYHLMFGRLERPIENPYTRRSQIGVVAALNAWLLSHSGLELQTKFLSRGSAGGPAPQIDCQAPSSSHNEPPFTSFADHSAQFLDRRIVRLPACHPPDHLDKGVTHHRVTTPVNAAFPPPTITVVNAGAQPGVTGNLTTILEPVPAADLQFERDPASS